MRNLTIVFVLLILSSCSVSYKQLHKKAILVDTHNDIPSASIEKKVTFDTDLKGKTHSDLQRMKDGGVDVQFFSIFCGPEQAKPFDYANREMDSVDAWINRNPNKMMAVKNIADLNKAINENKIASLMGVEGGHMIEDDIKKLEHFYNRGARYLTLTWNNSTSWATSAADESTLGSTLQHKGLSELGKQIVRRMNELGMMIDVSHIGEQTFKDALAISTKPVIASHSNVYALCPHRRNLKDDQILAIAKNGGVIQLNFYAGFVDSNYEKNMSNFLAKYKPEIDSLIKENVQKDYARMMVTQKHYEESKAFQPPLNMLLNHLDYIVKLVGVDYVGFGSDFDGISAAPIELVGVESYPLITKALLERGYAKADIKKMLGGNLIRVLKAQQ
jgi:membrane dipeptidase